MYVHLIIFCHLLHRMSIFIVTASMLKCSRASEGGEREASQTHKILVLAFITSWMTGTWYKLKIPSSSFLWDVLFLPSHFIPIEIIWLNVCFIFHQIQKTGQIRIYFFLLWLFLFVYFIFSHNKLLSCCNVLLQINTFFTVSVFIFSLTVHSLKLSEMGYYSFLYLISAAKSNKTKM